MPKISKTVFLSALFSVSAAVSAGPSSGGAFVLDPNTLDGGGGASTGGAFTLSGTIGQPDASNAMTGGAFQLTGGFWRQAAGGGGGPGAIFQDSFE